MSRFTLHLLFSALFCLSFALAACSDRSDTPKKSNATSNNSSPEKKGNDATKKTAFKSPQPPKPTVPAEPKKKGDIYVQCAIGSNKAHEIILKQITPELKRICSDANLIIQEKADETAVKNAMNMGVIQVALGTVSKNYGRYASSLNAIPFETKVSIYLPTYLLDETDKSSFHYSGKMKAPDQVPSFRISGIRDANAEKLGKHIAGKMNEIPRLSRLAEKIKEREQLTALSGKNTVRVKFARESHFMSTTLVAALRDRLPGYEFTDVATAKLKLDVAYTFEAKEYGRNEGKVIMKRMTPVYTGMKLSVKVDAGSEFPWEASQDFEASYKAPEQMVSDMLEFEWINSTSALMNDCVSQIAGLEKLETPQIESGATGSKDQEQAQEAVSN